MAKGSLKIIIGPMFSSKTVTLINNLTLYADIGLRVMKIVHILDNRPEIGSTHHSSYKILSEKITCMKTSDLQQIDVGDYDVIGIDEGQFFPDLLTTIEFWVESLGKHVIVAGLDGDYQKRKFGQILDLIPLADEVEKLCSKCQICIDNNKKEGIVLPLTPAPFTKKLTLSKIQTEIGGKDLYIPVCRVHH